MKKKEKKKGGRAGGRAVGLVAIETELNVRKKRKEAQNDTGNVPQLQRELLAVPFDAFQCKVNLSYKNGGFNKKKSQAGSV